MFHALNLGLPRAKVTSRRLGERNRRTIRPRELLGEFTSDSLTPQDVARTNFFRAEAASGSLARSYRANEVISIDLHGRIIIALMLIRAAGLPQGLTCG